MSEMTDDMKLAGLMAIEKVIGPELADAKGEARDALLALQEQTGADRRAIEVGGEKVGEVGISYAKPRPAIAPGHEEEALDLLESMGLTERKPIKGWEQAFAHVDGHMVATETGETTDAIEWQGGYAKAASVRGCKPEVVIPRMRAALGDVDVFAALLGGGDDER